MIAVNEYRLGNYLLQKVANKILMLPCSLEHFALIARGETTMLFPVVLKPELLERCSFAENMDYALRPQAREFRLLLPVIGSNVNEIMGYVKSNGECFARAAVNGGVASNNLHQLHQLQNLYYALTGAELSIK